MITKEEAIENAAICLGIDKGSNTLDWLWRVASKERTHMEDLDNGYQRELDALVMRVTNAYVRRDVVGREHLIMKIQDAIEGD